MKMKQAAHPHHVNLLLRILTKNSVVLISNVQEKSKHSDFVQKVTFEITNYEDNKQYDLLFVVRLVFDAGIPVYYISTPTYNISLSKTSYDKLLTKMYKRAAQIWATQKI